MEGNNTSTSEYTLAKRLTYLKINLDTILNNVKILKDKCAEHTKILAVVKGNAYGHGAVAVSHYLENNGVENFAVATSGEGQELRESGIASDILVLGNAASEDITTLHDQRLIPTVASIEFLQDWHHHWSSSKSAQNGHSNGHQISGDTGYVCIKVDSGMSRNGCQVEELPSLVQFCQDHQIPIHSIMTHFAQAWDDPVFTQLQLDTFLKAVKPYRSLGMKVHVANSGAIINSVGVDLDFVRPGISLYGQPPDTSEIGVSLTKKLGLRPALSWNAKPSLVKVLPKGRVVGYDQTYRCEKQETIATFPLGYADGYNRHMCRAGILTTKDGISCQLVGRVSMDAITVRLPDDAQLSRDFYVISDDIDSPNSAVEVARVLETIPYEVCTSLLPRVPRLYVVGGKTLTSYSV